MNAAAFFTDEEKNRLKEAVKQAERNTSGEIRVHVETYFTGNVMDRASTVFADLKIQKTELRNGVLFYLAIRNQEFAILGDLGINKLVPENFWNNIKDEMQFFFRQSDFTGGLCRGLEMAGEALSVHFAHSADDRNELSDEISFGNQDLKPDENIKDYKS